MMSAIVVIIIILGVIFLWVLFYSLLTRLERRQKRKLLKLYNEKDDLSKLGEDRARELRNADKQRKADSRKPVAESINGSERRISVQDAAPSDAGENSGSVGKASRSPRGLGKLRRGK